MSSYQQKSRINMTYRHHSLVLLLMTFAYQCRLGAASVNVSTFFYPDRVDRLIVGQVTTVFVNCSVADFATDGLPVLLRPRVVDAEIAVIDGEDDVVWCWPGRRHSNGSSFDVRGLFLGRTIIKIEVLNSTRHTEEGIRARSRNERDGKSVSAVSGTKSDDVVAVFDYQVSVIRKERLIDHMFMGLVTVMVICANIGMGCKIELPVVKEVLMKPIAPAIGFGCQYIIMPLTSFAILKLVGLTGGVALGYFATGCAPGGGSSNMYTFLLGGDVSLSVTMTLVSILASLGMIPLWLFTLGRLLIEEHTQITIPFGNIMVSLACILIPVIIGLVIQRFCKRGAKVILRCLRPLYIIFILCMFTLGVWSNLYIFRLIMPILILAGCTLPYVGFGLSALVALICRQPRSRILTIAIETGIQNTGLAIILMKFSLPQPEADLAIVAPIVVAMFMPLPLWIAVAVTEIRRRCCHEHCGPKEEALREMTASGKPPIDGETQVDVLLSGTPNGVDSGDTTKENGCMDSVENGKPAVKV